MVFFPRFIFGNHKHKLTKVLDFRFGVKVFTIDRQVGIFIRIFACFESIS